MEPGFERVGTSRPVLPSIGLAAAFGHNSDVKYVKIYRDTNFNDQLDAGDELFQLRATTQFSQTDENDHIVNIPLVTRPELIAADAAQLLLGL